VFSPRNGVAAAAYYGRSPDLADDPMGGDATGTTDGEGTTESTAYQYIRVRPSADPLPADRLTEQFEQLHRSLDGHTVEVLVTSTPAADELRYYLGTAPAAGESLRRVCGRLFPDSYALTEATSPLPEFDPAAAATLQGVPERPADWQTRLRPPSFSSAPEQHETARVEAAPGLPLDSVIEGLLAAPGPVVYQALLKPKPDWGGEAEYRVDRLDRAADTVGQRLVRAVVGPVEADEETTTTPAHRRGDTGSQPGTRIDAILAKSARNCYDVNARVLAGGPDAAATVRDLAAAFGAIGGDFYDVRAAVHTDERAEALATALRQRTFHDGDGVVERLRRRLPLGSTRSPRVVADATTVPHFCLFDGSSLTAAGRRALRALPGERTGLTPPTAAQLDRYDHGLALGHPVRQDGARLATTVSLPPALQPLHAAWFGKTGSGKSTALVNAILANHGATDGADILVDPKGDGMARAYLRAHYAEYGDLEDVYYFDCRETLPAVGFFDIRDDLAAGVARTTAVQDVVDHYVEILRGVMGAEAFDAAVRSPDVIRYLVKALFDADHGADAFTHRELEAAVHRFRDSETPPTVGDDDLQRMLRGVTENDRQAFARIMQGVANRIEKVPLDDRLARVFNHVPDRGASGNGAGEGDGPEVPVDPEGERLEGAASGAQPSFDLRRVLDEDAVVILDTGGVRAGSQRSLALVLLSALWTALRRRRRAADGDDLPLVNLYLEEAADLAVSDLVSELLARSRGFGLSVTLAMQFPAQLREADSQAYAELMNNVSTVVTGNVAVDTNLQQRLATDDMPPEDVGNRLRALSRGEWLASLPAPFAETEPRPFVLESLDLPPGHPDGDAPLSDARRAAFEAQRELVASRTRERAGLAINGDGAAPDAGGDAGRRDRVDTTLPYTDRLPAPVTYDAAADALVCRDCEARYPGHIDGVRRAVGCCHDLAALDRDDVPVCRIDLTLTAAERAASGWTDGQLMFLQAVYDATHQRFDPLAYDLRRDSMLRLRDDVGIDAAAVEELIEAGLLREDGTRPHTLYTVTVDGREAIGVSHRAGIAHGDGVGDLSESSLHALLVAVGAQLLRERFVEGGPATRVRRYHDVTRGRLDAAALDGEGRVVAALEAERPTNDLAQAVPEDYDVMAATDPTAALWVVPSRGAAHAVLEALNDPADGNPRVEKTYSEGYAPQRFNLDAPGCTAIHTRSYVENSLLETAPDEVQRPESPQ
jgi:hypothetical protein